MPRRGYIVINPRRSLGATDNQKGKPRRGAVVATAFVHPFIGFPTLPDLTRDKSTNNLHNYPPQKQAKQCARPPKDKFSKNKAPKSHKIQNKSLTLPQQNSRRASFKSESEAGGKIKGVYSLYSCLPKTCQFLFTTKNNAIVDAHGYVFTYPAHSMS
ncbi:MAG: hypothetical protein NC102_06555 [Clostridium sp.]|nr:hypothetical protein [Clostridium sp.]